MINVVLAFMIIICFLLAMIIHEYTHALVASWLGDPTPRSQGRQRLSLRAHIDPIGTLLCVLLAFQPVGAAMGLGWGKPAKTDPWKLRGGPNVGTLMVAIAGIVVSLVVGLLVAFLLQLLPNSFFQFISLNNGVVTIKDGLMERVTQFLIVFSAANIGLALFNLLPIYPLDGYQILYTLLPSRQALKFARSTQYGPLIIFIILFVLPFVGTLTHTSGFPLFRIPYYLLQGIFGLMSLVSGKPLDGLYNLYSFL